MRQLKLLTRDPDQRMLFLLTGHRQRCAYGIQCYGVGRPIRRYLRNDLRCKEEDRRFAVARLECRCVNAGVGQPSRTGSGGCRGRSNLNDPIAFAICDASISMRVLMVDVLSPAAWLFRLEVTALGAARTETERHMARSLQSLCAHSVESTPLASHHVHGGYGKQERDGHYFVRVDANK